jgi:hypothetical protein
MAAGIRSIESSILLAILITVLLSACGPDDSATARDAQNDAARDTPLTASNDASAGSRSAAVQSSNTPGSAVSPAMPDPASNNVSDSAITNAQASLAADNQQVAPVMRYAPADPNH